jgi:hypothetical protein
MTLKSRKKNEGKTDLLPRHCFLEIPKYIIFGKGMEKDKKKKKQSISFDQGSQNQGRISINRTRVSGRSDGNYLEVKFKKYKNVT